MNDKYREQWERLGDSDPYWAVLTDPENKGNKWNRSEFFKSGEAEVEKIFIKLKSLEIIVNFSTAVDFGCGVGRLSRALAKRFDKVTAIDISSSMLREARKINQHIKNINFMHNTVNDLAVIPSASIDFLYSKIVLQHMPPERQKIFIKEFCRVLRPKGILIFQTPSSKNLWTYSGWVHMIFSNRVLNILRRIKYGSDGIMELHTLKRKKVLEILKQGKMKIVLVEKNNSTGPSFKSYMYYFKKA